MNVCWFSIEESTHSFSNGAINTPWKQLPGLCGDSHPLRLWTEGCSAGIPPLLLNSLTTRVALYKWLWLSISRKKSSQLLQQQKSPKRCLTHQEQLLTVCRMESQRRRLWQSLH